MAMLDCHEASAVGARILARAADAFMTVGEAAAVAAMRALGASAGGDPRIVSGESGAAGLAGLMRASREPGLREALSIGAASRVLLFSTEGATDPDIYAGLTA